MSADDLFRQAAEGGQIMRRMIPGCFTTFFMIILILFLCQWITGIGIF